MAIQQTVAVALTLVGDGSSTVFTYSFNQLFAFAPQAAVVVNSGTLPTSATAINPDGYLPTYVPTLDGFGNIVLTFSGPWTGEGTATILLAYNSGTLSGTTQAWTSATATNTTWTLPLNGQNNVQVGFVVSGTVSAGVIAFQVSQDGANWLPIQGAQASAYNAVTSWNSTLGTSSFEFDTAGFAYLRVNLTTPITGSGTVTFIIQSSQVSLEPVPTVGQSNAALLNATVVGTTLTKGTQGSTGFSVQELKDAGRTAVTLSATAVAGVTSETIFSLSQNKGGTVTTGVTSYTITSGKTLRIQNISVSVRAGAAAVPFSRVTLRSNTAGATIATSPVLVQCPEVFGISATTGVGGQMSMDIPDGLEIAGNGTVSIGLSHLDQATTNVINLTLTGYEY
jgi:hypothetical protein